MEWKQKLIEFAQRRKQIYEDHVNGLSYDNLAKKYNVSGTRIKAIIKHEKQLLAD